MAFVTCLSKDVIKNLISHMAWLDTELATLGPVEHAILKKVSYGLVSHVDGAIGERLNNELAIPRKLSTETKVS
jgi:hypothetical protein